MSRPPGLVAQGAKGREEGGGTWSRTESGATALQGTGIQSRQFRQLDPKASVQGVLQCSVECGPCAPASCVSTGRVMRVQVRGVRVHGGALHRLKVAKVAGK